MVTGLLLGVDLGTSGARALLVDAKGGVAGRGTAEYPTFHPMPGQSEQDPDAWWEAIARAVREAVGEAGPAHAVDAMAVSGQMHGTVLLGPDRQPLGPAIIWADQRAHEDAARISAAVGEPRMLDMIGGPLAAGFQAATIGWLRRAHPETWEGVRRVLLPKDEVRLRLTGEVATDPSDASGTGLFDQRSRGWSRRILDAVGIDASFLAPVIPSAARAGVLSLGAAEALGLRPGIPVATGAGDTASALLGAGVTAPDSVLLAIGTGGQVAAPMTRMRVDPAGRTHALCTAIEPERGAAWYQLAATLSAGMSLRWLRDAVLAPGEGVDYDDMAGWAARVPPGAGGLLFLPYLVGERTPHMDPLARGAFLGLTAAHGRGHLVRAVLEGVTFALADAHRVLASAGAGEGSLVFAGGGARSPLWRQIVADVFGVRVAVHGGDVPSALGAALLAGEAAEWFDAAEASRSWAGAAETVEPDAERRATYEEIAELWRAAYRNNRAAFVRLAAIDAASATGAAGD